MQTPVNWPAIVNPLDVFEIAIPQTFIRRWRGFERTDTGLLLRCETISEQAVDFYVDVVLPDVIRVRMNPRGLHAQPSDILLQDHWIAPPFDVVESEGQVTLGTARLRVEIQQFPWQMRVFDRDDDALPFFSQRIDDRAYGPAYEVPPVGYARSANGDISVYESVAATPGEAFYGFGEKFTALDKWGQEVVSWSVDCGNVTSHRSYKNVPFFMSTAGYGVFVHTSQPVVYRMGTESSITYSFHVAGSQLDYFLIRGPQFSHILRRYSDLTGFASVPPKWSFGFWTSRAGYKTQAEVEDIVREMRARDFPCDVLSIDPWWMGEAPWSTLEWDRAQFPDPEGMMRTIREQGVKTCLWITPYAPENTPFYDEGKAQGYFITDSDGQIAPVLEAFAGGELAAVDFTNPGAADWFLGKLETLLDQGVATFKTDFGEQAPTDAVYHDGRGGIEMHNLYPLLYNRAVFGLTARKFGRGLVWGRAAYAGSQRYPVQWGGDSYASFDQMAGQVRALLSYGISGVPFCSHDVGGFDYSPQAFDQGQPLDVGEHVSTVSTSILESFPKDPVIYVRWLQFGAFSSHMRAHGKGPHEPWTYGEEPETIARDYLKLRYRLLPYLYTMAVQASETGLPVVRPMVLGFQHDPTTHRLDTQYMFGDSFLVVPVLNHAHRYRVYLPAGTWVDYWTKTTVQGPRWIDGVAPLDALPLWVRGGAIIPMGPEMAYVGEKPLDPLTVELYAPQDSGEFTIYDEDRDPVQVRYVRDGEQLTVTVEGVPGAVVVQVYGIAATLREHADNTFTFDVEPQGTA